MQNLVWIDDMSCRYAIVGESSTHMLLSYPAKVFTGHLWKYTPVPISLI